MKEKSQTSEEDNKDKSIILAKTVIKKKKGKKCQFLVFIFCFIIYFIFNQ